jgi:pimeloyl-ACP methyl ester carboxylesterase
MTTPGIEQAFFTTPDGMAHAYYDLGHPGAPGPAIVMQHGFSATTWHEWVAVGISDRIATLGRRVIGIDALGHGRSTRSHDSRLYGDGRMARDVGALADHLGLESFDFVGYSMGGIIGLALAAVDQRVRRLVVAGIGEGVIEVGGVDTRHLSRKVLAEGLRAADPTDYPPLVRAFRSGMIEMGNDLLAMAAHADAGQPPPIDLKAITAPTLLIAGDADPLAIHPERLAAALPDCTLSIVPGDHVQARLSPEFTAAVMAFLND